jgi:SpoVK/Ycf46/Vps4 family AAA+-type ATPase
MGGAIQSGKDGMKSPETIDSMIISERPMVKWDDIGGLTEAKREVREAVILPMVKGKPDFVEIPRTILLYGPPGTGKTLLAKAASSNLKAMFFEAKTSALLSKYYGESEKIIEALFEKARKNQPSIIFMDEFDSIMLTRDAGVHEATRRVISQLLTEIDGFSTGNDGKVIIMAATNRPWDLDDAMISRFQRKIYVPLPDAEARRQIFEIHMKGTSLSDVTITRLSEMSNGYSGRDIANVCREAIMFMIREQNPKLEDLTPTQIEKYAMMYRPLTKKDFDHAFSKIRRTVNAKLMGRYEEWEETLGS